MASPALRTESARILIVEDEGIIARHIATRLEKAGYTVAGIASSSEEALRGAAELAPDLILMDIHIKGHLDGVATALELRHHCDIPLVYLTAHSDYETIDRAKKTGAFGFLTKPIHHTSLSTTIEMALSKHRSDCEARRQQALLETTIKTIADGVAVLDSDRKVRFLNGPAEKLTGWTNEDARHENIASVLRITHPPHGFWDEVFSDSGRKNQSLMPFPQDAQAASRAGHLFAVEGEIASSLDGGMFVGKVITFRDVTPRLLEEQRKRQELKMQAIGRLASGIAHDFNNLLFVILGFTEDMQSRGGTSSADGLQEIRKAAETAAGITRELLLFSRPEAVQAQELSLNDIVRDTEGMWRRLAGNAIQWDSSLDPELALVRADPGQMKQVLMNLVANARDAMPDGGLICVSTANRKGFVDLAVKDAGTGMSRETIDRLFEPYFTTKVNGKGTGLGLSIVHRIVYDLGGSIDVESELGKGTVFTICLPALPVREPGIL